MTTIINVEVEKITPSKIDGGTVGSYGFHKLSFRFSSEWKGLGKRIVFDIPRSAPVALAITDDTAEYDIPAEVKAYAGEIPFTIEGYFEDNAIYTVSGVVMVTSSAAKPTRHPPTPSEVQQIYTYLSQAQRLYEFAFNPKGKYSDEEAYNYLDVIEYNNDIYIAKKFVKGVEPADGEYYMLAMKHGESAYEIAIRLGTFEGTEEEWNNYIAVERDKAIDAIVKKAAETLASIPEDYTELYNQVQGKFDKANVEQSTGDAEDKVMSQKAVTDELGKLSEEISDEATERQAAIVQERNRAVARENEIEKLFTMPTQAAVDKWLNEHPEATTTVQDKSLTIDKMVVGTLGYVTPEMFGAKGDGVTDDTNAIQMAVLSGIPVYFSNKTYVVKAVDSIENANTVSINYAVTLITDTVLYGNNTKIVTDCCAFYGNSVKNVVISGFDFTSTNKTVCMPIVEMDNSSYVTLKNIQFHEYYGDGAVLYGCGNVLIDHLCFENFTGHGLSFGKMGELRCYNSEINNVKVINQSAYATSDSANPMILTCHDVNISNIYCENTAWGIKLQLDSYNVTFNDVTFIMGDKSTSNTGLKIQGSENNRINGVYVANYKAVNNATEGYALYITYADKVDIQNPEFQNCSFGIRIIDSDVTFNNLRFIETATGLYCGDESPLIVDGCYIYSTTTRNVFSVDSKTVNLHRIIADSPDEVPMRILASRNKEAHVKIDNVKLVKLNTSAFQIACNCLISNVSYNTSNVFAISLSNNTYTDVATPLAVIVSNNLCNVATVGRVLNESTNTAKNGGIHGVSVTNNRIRTYHNTSDEERSYVYVLDGVCITAI